MKRAWPMILLALLVSLCNATLTSIAVAADKAIEAALSAKNAAETASAATAADGFKPLFNGKDLTGWDGDPRLWSVQDGVITGESTKEKPAKHNTFLIYRGGIVKDFEIKFDYAMQSDSGNSGLQYRSFELPSKNDDDKWIVGGYQADIDSGNTYTGILYGERDRGILAQRGQKVVIQKGGKPQVTGKLGDAKELAKSIKGKGQWNSYRVVVQGNHAIHEINGVVMADITDEDNVVTELKGARTSGILAFQLHQGPPMKIQFRNVVLKDLPAAAGAPGPTGDKVPPGPAGPGAKKKVVLVAGGASHGYGAHDHKSGCNLLAKLLNESGLPIEALVTYPGWPKDNSIFDGASAIIVYADGGGGHPINAHVKKVAEWTKKGMGIGFIHYGVETVKGEPGDAFLDWTGAYFEANWSVNPHWTPKDITLTKDHAITRGVKPFSVNDEWYFHMRLRADGDVTPIFSAVPTPDTMSRSDGSHSGNPTVREAVKKGEPQALMWARQRPDGGRGFGFTGGHVHWNWGHPDQRKIVLNAIAWIAGAEVPADGVAVKPLTFDDLDTNHDEGKPKNFNADKISKQLETWNAAK